MRLGITYDEVLHEITRLSVVSQPGPECPECGTPMHSRGREWACNECGRRVTKQKRERRDPAMDRPACPNCGKYGLVRNGLRRLSCRDCRHWFYEEDVL